MSKFLRNNLNIHSSGTFFTNKPKIIKFNQNHNTSHETIPKETNNKDNKDEIILILKKRISILEKKVKMLENNNQNKINKTNTLNLSHGQQKKKFNLLHSKLNIKLTKNKNNLFNFLNKSSTFSKKTSSKNNSISSLNNSNHKNYINTIEDNKIIINSRRRNFFNNIYSNEKSNTNSNYLGIRLGNSASKNQKRLYTIIPKNKKKQKLFINVLRRTTNKYSTIDHGKFQNDVKNDSNSTIPKIPRKGKQHKSEIIKNNSNKFLNKINNLKININNKSKIIQNIKLKNTNEFFLYNNNYKDKSCILNTENFVNNKNNNNSFKNIKEKLDNIKDRTKNLLEFYFSKKNEKNFFCSKDIYNNIDNSNNILDSEENNNKEFFKYNYK